MLLLHGEISRPKNLVKVEELAISNMYEIGALIELLEKKGIITKQESLDTIQELRWTTPQADAKPYSKGDARIVSSSRSWVSPV